MGDETRKLRRERGELSLAETVPAGIAGYMSVSLHCERITSAALRLYLPSATL